MHCCNINKGRRGDFFLVQLVQCLWVATRAFATARGDMAKLLSFCCQFFLLLQSSNDNVGLADGSHCFGG